MAETSALKMIGDYGYPLGKIVMNPNDGYDLGLLATAMPVRIHGTIDSPDGSRSNGYLFDGSLLQENNCRLGTVVVSLKFYQQLGKPPKVRLELDGPNLTISPM